MFDMENRWAIGRAGPRTAASTMRSRRAHYRALWRMGIPVDIVDEECVISGYKLVIAPMLYLLRAGFEEKLKAFVENGGILIGTYHTGLANDSDLCYLSGWPGAGLGECLACGTRTPTPCGTMNATPCRWGKVRPEGNLRPHPSPGAQVLGTYGQDFYKGRPPSP